MTTSQKLNEIMNTLGEMHTEDVVALWNTYCDDAQLPDDYIHENNAFVIIELFGENTWE